jgi:hypothetical protein
MPGSSSGAPLRLDIVSQSKNIGISNREKFNDIRILWGGIGERPSASGYTRRVFPELC